jgi:hypothetical protein
MLGGPAVGARFFEARHDREVGALLKRDSNAADHHTWTTITPPRQTMAFDATINGEGVSFAGVFARTNLTPMAMPAATLANRPEQHALLVPQELSQEFFRSNSVVMSTRTARDDCCARMLSPMISMGVSTMHLLVRPVLSLSPQVLPSASFIIDLPVPTFSTCVCPYSS